MGMDRQVLTWWACTRNSKERVGSEWKGAYEWKTRKLNYNTKLGLDFFLNTHILSLKVQIF